MDELGRWVSRPSSGSIGRRARRQWQMSREQQVCVAPGPVFISEEARHHEGHEMKGPAARRRADAEDEPSLHVK